SRGPSLSPPWGRSTTPRSPDSTTSPRPPESPGKSAMSRYLYLVRHGEQQDAQHGLPDGPLSPRGVRQAQAIAERLSGVPFEAAWTSPLQRAQETARIMADRLPALNPQPSALLMDCVPSGPTPDLPHAWEPFFGAVTDDEIAAGEAQMADAVAEWLT